MLRLPQATPLLLAAAAALALAEEPAAPHLILEGAVGPIDRACMVKRKERSAEVTRAMLIAPYRTD